MRKIFLGSVLVLLAGCATIENETFSTINVNGRERELRTRTMTDGGRSYVTHSVRSQNGAWRTCDPSRRGSCESASRAVAGGIGR